MKKIQKNKKGFTLIEMVLVIAIIVILAAVLIISVGSYITRAQQAATAIDSHNDQVGIASSAVESAIAAAGTTAAAAT